MQDPRGILVHRLKFLNVVQQLARSDLEAAAAAVGLDALQSVIPLAPTSGGDVQRFVGRSKVPVGKKSFVSQHTTEVTQKHRRVSVRRSVSGLHSKDTTDKGEVNPVVAERKSLPNSNLNVASKNSSVQKQSDGVVRSFPRSHGRGRVSARDIGALREMLLGSGVRADSRGEAAKDDFGERAGNKIRPEWDNRFGVGTLGDGKVATRARASSRHPLPLAKPVNPLNEEVPAGDRAKSLSEPDNFVSAAGVREEVSPAQQQPQYDGSTPVDRPPIGPQSAATRSLSQGTDVSPSGAEGTASLGNSLAAGGLTTSAVEEAASATNRSETPLAGSRIRRGSAVKARPRPKAAGGAHGLGGGAMIAGQPLRPSDFSAVDAELRRQSQLTPMFSPSPTGMASSAAGAASSGNNTDHSARGAGVGAIPVLQGGNASPHNSAQQASPQLTPTKALGTRGSTSVMGSPPNTGPSPLALGKGSAPLSESDGVNSTSNNPPTSPRSVNFADREEEEVIDYGERLAAVNEQLRVDERLREAENERMLAAAKAEALELAEQQRQREIIVKVSSIVDSMLGEHTAIEGRQFNPRVVLAGQEGDNNALESRTQRKLRELEDRREREVRQLRGETTDGLAVLGHNLKENGRGVVDELELDRVLRRLREQESTEQTMGERLVRAACTASDARHARRGRRMGQIPAATINRLLKAKADNHEIIRFNERLWNTSTTSQYTFCDRLAGVLLEDLLSEIAYEEVDVMLAEYVEGLAEHELRIE